MRQPCRSVFLGVLLGLFILPLLGACGAAGPSTPVLVAEHPPRPPAEDRSIEELLADIFVTKEFASLPDLTHEDLAMILLHAKKANAAGRIRSVLLLEAIDGDELEVRVVYAPHEVKDRHCRYSSTEFTLVATTGSRGSRAGTTLRILSGGLPGLDVKVEICPPWRSYEHGAPPLEAERVHFWLAPDFPDDVLIGIADALRTRMPDGEHIDLIEKIEEPENSLCPEQEASWRRPGTPRAVRYEVDTCQGCSGLVFLVENLDGYWSAEEVGEWIS